MFTMNESSNRSRKCCKNLNNETSQKLCESVKKLRTFHENRDDEVKEKLRKNDQKRKQEFCKNLDDEAKGKL